jgi:anti-sigma B factor antagonist
MSTAPESEGDALATVDITAESGPRDAEWLLTVQGEIDVATSPRLRSELGAVLERGARLIVVDLTATSFIDSSGLGVLVGALKRLREHDGDAIVLRGVQEPVRRVFEITGLTDLFRIED